MERNEGGADRVLRMAVGIGLVGAAATSLIGPWGWIGLVPLLTGAVGYCPLYRLFNLSTCPRNVPKNLRRP
ncbi:hypothetical protein D3C87_1721860 [compost metagenome]|uniref:DUF2892 domain-containing protein n=1 Tax=Cupriavidus campinensis TaxID=151783 RepID=A0AAE9I477_9BURK|nr:MULTISPECIES: DUF2892 domain-containing protein [Cupriavidus]TSP11936.1 DUF2892 domain-containing protein [Cupriavidus campinensis]URF07429.1 DUF2892 domain-containing protein [Cupriavidus campinensis]